MQSIKIKTKPLNNKKKFRTKPEKVMICHTENDKEKLRYNIGWNDTSIYVEMYGLLCAYVTRFHCVLLPYCTRCKKAKKFKLYYCWQSPILFIYKALTSNSFAFILFPFSHKVISQKRARLRLFSLHTHIH